MIELNLVVLAPRLKNRKNRPSNNNWALQILKDSHLASLCCGAEHFFQMKHHQGPPFYEDQGSISALVINRKWGSAQPLSQIVTPIKSSLVLGCIPCKGQGIINWPCTEDPNALPLGPFPGTWRAEDIPEVMRIIFMILHAPVPVPLEKEMDAPYKIWSLMLDCCSIAAHGPLHPHNWSISGGWNVWATQFAPWPSKLPLSPVSCRWCCSFSSSFSSWSGLDIQHVRRFISLFFQLCLWPSLSLSLYENI